MTTIAAEEPRIARILQGTSDWEEEWTKGVDVGTRWDIGHCEPELAYELSLKETGVLSELFKRVSKGDSIRGLVPGCGRGYPVAAIAKAGIPCTGLELSQTAATLAREASPHPNAKFIVGDFFDPKATTDKYDIVFDSTFLCAISPLMWRQWAKRMDQIIAPKGFLTMQVFPVVPGGPERDPDAPGDEPGPPNRLTVQLVRELLKDYPFEEVLFRKTPPERNARNIARGLAVEEYFMIFRKRE